jgi:hypothetical protein
MLVSTCRIERLQDADQRLARAMPFLLVFHFMRGVRDPNFPIDDSLDFSRRSLLRCRGIHHRLLIRRFHR